ncbi:MAG: hypothetical protein HY606_12140 [Planctomycetes bacterium]|nr:hypothetical protein [Planctomycetota bacterium]
MRVNFAPSLLEQVVDEVIHKKADEGDTTLLSLFADLTEQAYSPAFASLKEEIFKYAYEYIGSKLELRKQVKEAAYKFPLLQVKVDEIILKPPEGKSEGADIVTVNDKQFIIVVEMRPRSLTMRNTFETFLPHEFLRAQDMIDPDFKYLRVSLDHLNSAEENIIRSRYGTIWDIYIDKRLDKFSNKEEHLERIGRNFSVSGENSEKILLFINNTPKLTHSKIFGYASAPASLMKEAKVSSNPSTYPGSNCSICAFPSFTFAEIKDPDLFEIIKSEKGDLNPESGICPRCVEYYQIKLGRF